MNWEQVLKEEVKKQYFLDISKRIRADKQQFCVFPNDIFRAFTLTRFEDIKVVILGQDPYHGFGEATGLSFSVDNDRVHPPSLRNIKKELRADLQLDENENIPNDLSDWAKQGVFLLNTCLTVIQDRPKSHEKIGWQIFTTFVIEQISKHKPFCVFCLWGDSANQFAPSIDEHKHLILSTSHPSPFSAHKGFIGCKHFSRANKALIEKGIKPIRWI